MAAVSRENWVERIRDPKIECMSRDEMAALQSRRLVEVVNRVYNNVEFYRKKMQDMGIEPGDIKSIDDIYTTGSTIERAAGILKKAGVENVYFLTLSIGQGI